MQCLVDGGGSFRGTAALTQLHFFPKSIDRFRSDKFLCAHAPHDLGPVGFFTTLLELMPDGVDHPVGKKPEEDVRIRAAVFLVIYGTQAQVCLQLPVGALYFTNKIVVVPRLPKIGRASCRERV